MTHADLYEAIALFKRVLAEDPERKAFTLNISRTTAEMILDHFQSMDPDMPPRPVCKILGPLVGDVMMNEKLNRLDDLANSLGPNMIRLAMIIDRLEKR